MNKSHPLASTALNPDSSGTHPRSIIVSLAGVILSLGLLTVGCGATRPSEPRFLDTCGHRPTTPVKVAAVTKTLNDHGFAARITGVGCTAPTVATIDNEDAPQRDKEGDVSCSVSINSGPNRSKYPRRLFEWEATAFTGTYFAIANVTCVLFGDQADPKGRLRAALTALRGGI
jgi:hypothetical protein